VTIEIRKPELERLAREEILNGHFQNFDDLIAEALQALREKNARRLRPRKNLAEFLLNSPFAGSDLNLERDQDYGRCPAVWRASPNLLPTPSLGYHAQSHACFATTSDIPARDHALAEGIHRQTGQPNSRKNGACLLAR
jgi:hypothetical protein